MQQPQEQPGKERTSMELSLLSGAVSLEVDRQTNGFLKVVRVIFSFQK